MGSYLDGAWYPVGGSGVFAREFARAITAAGGELRVKAEVAGVRVDDRRVLGVTLADNEKARILGPDGLYQRLVAGAGQKACRSQFEFVRLAAESAETIARPVDGRTRFPKVKLAPRPFV